MLLLVYKSLKGLNPEYIYDLFKELTSKLSRALRSMDSGQTGANQGEAALS